MRLYVSAASPFARKCRIVARERGVDGRLTEVTADPMADDARLIAANPVAQVPALELDDGGWLIDSPVICAFLDALPGKPALTPPVESAEHWRVRRAEAVADACLEMAVKIVLENRRPDGERSERWIARWRAGLLRALEAAEAEVRPPEPLDMGSIAVGCVGAYLDLRHPDLGWRESRPRLAAFCDAMEARASFRATHPG